MLPLLLLLLLSLLSRVRLAALPVIAQLKNLKPLPKPVVARCFAGLVFRRQPPCSLRFAYIISDSSAANIALPDRLIWDLANPAQQQQPHPQSPDSARCIFRRDEHRPSCHRSVALRHHNVNWDIVADNLQGRWQ